MFNIHKKKNRLKAINIYFQGTSCTVSSYYLPSGDLERSEIDIEVFILVNK